MDDVVQSYVMNGLRKKGLIGKDLKKLEREMRLYGILMDGVKDPEESFIEALSEDFNGFSFEYEKGVGDTTISSHEQVSGVKNRKYVGNIQAQQLIQMGFTPEDLEFLHKGKFAGELAMQAGMAKGAGKKSEKMKAITAPDLGSKFKIRKADKYGGDWFSSKSALKIQVQNERFVKLKGDKNKYFYYGYKESKAGPLKIALIKADESYNNSKYAHVVNMEYGDGLASMVVKKSDIANKTLHHILSPGISDQKIEKLQENIASSKKNISDKTAALRKAIKSALGDFDTVAKIEKEIARVETDAASKKTSDRKRADEKIDILTLGSVTMGVLEKAETLLKKVQYGLTEKEPYITDTENFGNDWSKLISDAKAELDKFKARGSVVGVDKSVVATATTALTGAIATLNTMKTSLVANPRPDIKKVSDLQGEIVKAQGSISTESTNVKEAFRSTLGAINTVDKILREFEKVQTEAFRKKEKVLATLEQHKFILGLGSITTSVLEEAEAILKETNPSKAKEELFQLTKGATEELAEFELRKQLCVDESVMDKAVAALKTAIASGETVDLAEEKLRKTLDGEDYGVIEEAVAVLKKAMGETAGLAESELRRQFLLYIDESVVTEAADALKAAIASLKDTNDNLVAHESGAYFMSPHRYEAPEIINVYDEDMILSFAEKRAHGFEGKPFFLKENGEISMITKREYLPETYSMRLEGAVDANGRYFDLWVTEAQFYKAQSKNSVQGYAPLISETDGTLKYLSEDNRVEDYDPIIGYDGQVMGYWETRKGKKPSLDSIRNTLLFSRLSNAYGIETDFIFEDGRKKAGEWHIPKVLRALGQNTYKEEGKLSTSDKAILRLGSITMAVLEKAEGLLKMSADNRDKANDDFSEFIEDADAELAAFEALGIDERAVNGDDADAALKDAIAKLTEDLKGAISSLREMKKNLAASGSGISSKKIEELKEKIGESSKNISEKKNEVKEALRSTLFETVAISTDINLKNLIQNKGLTKPYHDSMKGYVPLVSDLSGDLSQKRIHAVMSLIEGQETGLPYVPVLRKDGKNMALAYYLKEDQLDGRFFYYEKEEAWVLKAHAPDGYVPVVNSRQDDWIYGRELRTFAGEPPTFKRRLKDSKKVLDENGKDTGTRYLEVQKENYLRTPYRYVKKLSRDGEFVNTDSVYHIEAHPGNMIPIKGEDGQIQGFIDKGPFQEHIGLPENYHLIRNTETSAIEAIQYDDPNVEARNDSDIPIYTANGLKYVSVDDIPDGYKRIVNYIGPSGKIEEVAILIPDELDTKRLRPIKKEIDGKLVDTGQFFLLQEEGAPLRISERYVPIIDSKEVQNPDAYFNADYIDATTQSSTLKPLLGVNGETVAFVDVRPLYKSFIVNRLMVEISIGVQSYNRQQKTSRKRTGEEKEERKESERDHEKAMAMQAAQAKKFYMEGKARAKKSASKKKKK